MFDRSPPRPRFAMLSTYPPTACGIATFAAALTGALEGRGIEVGVVRVGHDNDAHPDRRVVAELINDSAFSITHVAQVLSRYDVAIIQHEYGVYSGPDGADVVEVLRAINTPTIVVAHTVLIEPTPHQRLVLEQVAQLASAVVVMTESARSRLVATVDVDPAKVFLIPHGAGLAQPDTPTTKAPDAAPRLLTWGLLGPGKGIEWMLDALALIPDGPGAPTYLIAGRTHPKVAAFEGERYRYMLKDRIRCLGLGSRVTFDPTYRDLAGLAELIAQASVVVLPYDSIDQVTSGVLVDAVAAGCPVIATNFPHAVELLDAGAGLVVPRRNPQALAGAVTRALHEPGLLASMTRHARALGPELSWDAVAAQYTATGLALADRESMASQ